MADGTTTLANALENLAKIEARLGDRRPIVFLDYDGTLTPIVERPEMARLPAETGKILRRLATICTVAVVSGRDLGDVRALVGLDSLVYAGSHGFDIAGPAGLRIQHEEGSAFVAAVNQATAELGPALAGINGVIVEPKHLAVAVHYRQVAPADVAKVEAIVDRVDAAVPELRKTSGKKVFELRPRFDWDKGKAVLWLLDTLTHDGAKLLPFYFGDDLTDEDAFRALADRGITIFVGELGPTAAHYRLNDPGEVATFLSKLADFLDHADRR